MLEPSWDVFTYKRYVSSAMVSHSVDPTDRDSQGLEGQVFLGRTGKVLKKSVCMFRPEVNLF